MKTINLKVTIFFLSSENKFYWQSSIQKRILEQIIEYTFDLEKTDYRLNEFQIFISNHVKVF